MGLPSKIGWGLWSGLLSAGALFVSQKLVNAGWRTVVGDEPPEPNDPKTPAAYAFAWAALSGIGIGLAQLAVNRFAARRWESQTGIPAPSVKNINFKL